MRADSRKDRLVRSLAGTVARENGCQIGAICAAQRECRAPPGETTEFPDLVEECRRKHLKRRARKIAGLWTTAVDGLAAGGEKDESQAKVLEAATALAQEWDEVLKHFDPDMKISSLRDRVRILEEGRPGHGGAMSRKTKE